MNNDNGGDFQRQIELRLLVYDHHGVFSHGCCFHFALMLHRLYSYSLAYYKSPDGGVGHCWAMKKGGTSIDIRGVMDQDTLLELIMRGDSPPKVLPITPDALRAELDKKKFTADMNARLFALAEHIITTHLRFGDAKPVNDIFKSESELQGGSALPP